MSGPGYTQTEPTPTACSNLLLFSDIEGCIKTSNAGKEQHQLFCDSDTFYSIYKYLQTLGGNHVGFCGDFFDQGPKMGESIIGMAWLKQLFPGKVHIILGNRDVNKMRIMAELNMIREAKKKDITSIDGTKIYSRWQEEWINRLPPNYDTLTGDERFQFLLEKTFGAPKLLSNLMTEFTELVDETQVLDKTQAIALFQTIFTGNVVSRLPEDGLTTEEGLPRIPTKDIANFVIACKIILYSGKLIYRLQVGKKHVLLSHAGSPNPVMYSHDYMNMMGSAYTSKATIDIGSVANIANYYETLEAYRRPLVCKQEYGNVITTNDDNTRYDLTNLVDVEQVITNINLLKQQAYEDMFKPDLKDKVSAAWLLVQAMGIGTHPVKEFQLASPIQSCILIANCNVKIPYLNKRLLKHFKQSSNTVDVTVHGHVPFCGVVPIIGLIGAPREDDTGAQLEDENVEKLIFVALDTSNGNNPKIFDAMTLENVPLAYFTENTVGVGSLQSNGTVNLASDNIKRKDDSGKFMIHACKNGDIGDTDPDYHRGLVQTYYYEFAESEIPTIDEINALISSTAYMPMAEYKQSTKEKRVAEAAAAAAAAAAAERLRKDDRAEAPLIRDREEVDNSLPVTRAKSQPLERSKPQEAGNKNKSKNKRLRKCRKCLMCCNGSCDYNAKLNNTKRGSRKRKKARKTIKKSNNSKQRTRKQKKARKHKK